MGEESVDRAFTQIYESTYHEVLCFVASKCSKTADIADMVQNTYVHFYSRLCAKGLEHVRDPRRYLMRIARGELCRHYGYLAVMRRCLPAFSQEEISPEDELRFLSEDTLQQQVDACELWERISQEDELTVSIFTLYFLGDLKIREIAKRLNQKESFVKNRLYRTLRALRAEYAKEEADRCDE